LRKSDPLEEIGRWLRLSSKRRLQRVEYRPAMLLDREKAKEHNANGEESDEEE
jgi:hypothetical protein